MGHGIDLQQFWTNHIVVNDNMVAVLKRNLGLDPDLYGLQIVTQDDHVRAFGKKNTKWSSSVASNRQEIA